MNEILDGFFDKNLRLPVYHQIYLTIRDWMLSGRIPIGTQLPTEASLCATFSVSRITIRKAIDLLEKENLVSREQGRGTFVSDSVSAAPYTEQMSRLLARLARMAERTEVTDIRVQEKPANEDVRLDLGLSPGALVSEIFFVRMSNGQRMGTTLGHIPADLGLTISFSDISTKSLLDVIEQQGVELGSADQLISAVLADPQDATQLQVAAGAPLVQIRLVANDLHYRPVVRIVANFPAELYRHHIHLVRHADVSGQSHWIQSQA